MSSETGRTQASRSLLTVADLCVEFTTSETTIPVLRNIDVKVEAGKIHGIVGESGCGKSTFAKVLLRLLPSGRARVSGKVEFAGRDLSALGPEQLRRIRGRDIGYIPQETVSALSPFQPIRTLFRDTVRSHLSRDSGPFEELAAEVLKEVGFENPKEILASYPHQLSTGMCQRVLVAAVLVLNPRLIVADEPTASLDAVTGRKLLDLFQSINQKRDVALLLITHNLAHIFRIAHHVEVFYAGEIVESGVPGRIRAAASHPYTSALLRSMPQVWSGVLPDGIGGEVPDLQDLPAGCAYHPRCERSTSQCRLDRPELLEPTAGRRFRCFNPLPGTDPPSTSEISASPGIRKPGSSPA